MVVVLVELARTPTATGVTAIRFKVNRLALSMLVIVMDAI
jgi:hypothetical protein